jgi:hypothetical protein
MVFYVKSIKGMNVGGISGWYDMPGNTTFREVKRKISLDTGIPIDSQKLIFNGMEMQNHRSLDEYGFNDNVKFIILSTYLP